MAELTTEIPYSNYSNSTENSEETLLLKNHTYSGNETFTEWLQKLASEHLAQSIPWTALLLILYLLVAIFGILGNSLVILAFICRPNMRSVINFFITNLAVADLLALLFCSVGNFLSNVFKSWILGLYVCKVMGYVQGVSVCASAHLLVAISVDRCKAVFRPLTRPPGLHRLESFYAVVGIWALALILPIPWAATLTLVPDDDEEGVIYCTEQWSNHLHGQIYFLVVNVCIFYAIPLVLIIIANIMIWYRINHSRIPGTSVPTITTSYMQRKTRNGVRRMLGIVTFIFLLSWLPLYVGVIISRYIFEKDEATGEFMHKLLPFAQWLGITNSSINPILYAFLNGQFRRAFQSLLPSCRKLFQKSKRRTAAERANIEAMEMR